MFTESGEKKQQRNRLISKMLLVSNLFAFRRAGAGVSVMRFRAVDSETLSPTRPILSSNYKISVLKPYGMGPSISVKHDSRARGELSKNKTLAIRDSFQTPCQEVAEKCERVGKGARVLVVKCHQTRRSSGEDGSSDGLSAARKYQLMVRVWNCRWFGTRFGVFIFPVWCRLVKVF